MTWKGFLDRISRRKPKRKSKIFPREGYIAYIDPESKNPLDHITLFYRKHKKNTKRFAAIAAFLTITAGTAIYAKDNIDHFFMQPSLQRYNDAVQMIETPPSSEKVSEDVDGDPIFLINYAELEKENLPKTHVVTEGQNLSGICSQNFEEQYGREPTMLENNRYIKKTQRANNLSLEDDVVLRNPVTKELERGKDGLVDKIYVGQELEIPVYEESGNKGLGAGEKLAYSGTLGLALGLAAMKGKRRSESESKSEVDSEPEIDLERLVAAKNDSPYKTLDRLAEESGIAGVKTRQDVLNGFAEYFNTYHDKEDGTIVKRYDRKIETDDMQEDRKALYAKDKEGLSDALKKYFQEQDKGIYELSVKETLEAYTAVYGMNMSKSTFYRTGKSRKEAIESAEQR